MKRNKKIYSGIIYSYTNIYNGKKYIGQTTRPKVRMHQHIKASINKTDNAIFHKAIRKYGINAFVYKVEKVISCSSYKTYRQRIDFYEAEFIKFYNSKEKGYNMTTGGGNVWNNECKKGKPLSEEHRRKISESGRKLHRTKNNSMDKNPKAKKVICEDKFGKIIKVYSCAKYICMDYPITYSNLKRKLRAKKCIINNLKFYYENDLKSNIPHK